MDLLCCFLGGMRNDVVNLSIVLDVRCLFGEVPYFGPEGAAEAEVVEGLNPKTKGDSVLCNAVVDDGNDGGIVVLENDALVVVGLNAVHMSVLDESWFSTAMCNSVRLQMEQLTNLFIEIVGIVKGGCKVSELMLLR